MAGCSIRITMLHVNPGGRWCRQQHGGFEHTTRDRGLSNLVGPHPGRSVATPLPLRPAREKVLPSRVATGWGEGFPCIRM